LEIIIGKDSSIAKKEYLKALKGVTIQNGVADKVVGSIIIIVKKWTGEED